MLRTLLLSLSVFLAAAAQAGPVSGTWGGILLGHPSALTLAERADGRLVGFLLADPTDVDAFAALLGRIEADTDNADTVGERAMQTVREKFLGFTSLVRWGRVIVELHEVYGGR